MSLESIGQDMGNRKKYILFTLDCPFPEKTFFIDIHGKKQNVISLRFIVRAEQEKEIINMQNKSFGSAQISFGKAENIDRDALVSIVESKDKPNTSAIMIKASQERDGEIVKLREVRLPSVSEH
jgi:hypothetical protein